MLSDGAALPFQYVAHNTKYARIITFYHTVGWTSYFTRNAGPFWEPGVFQLYLNIAIMFFICRIDKFRVNNKIEYFKLAILVITVLTTASSTGYVCLLLNFLLYMFSLKNTKIDYKNYTLIIVLIIIFLYIESTMGIASEKIINQGGSYTTRMNDTIQGYNFALRYPWIGVGLFSKTKAVILASVNVNQISNGLATMMISTGIPLTILYLVQIVKHLGQILMINRIPLIIACAILFLIVNSEAVMPLTFFLTFLFQWKEENNTLIAQKN
jgi:hypothetical protein